MKKNTDNGEFWRITLKRAFGWRLWLAVALIGLMFFLDTDISAKIAVMGHYPPQEHESAAHYVEGVLMFGNNYKLYLAFMTMGYAMMLPEEWKSGIVPYLVKKMGVYKYAAGQVAVSAFSGGAAAAGGFLLYLFVLRSKLPLLPENLQNSIYGVLENMPYYGELSLARARQFMVCLTVIFFLSGVTWTALAAGCSIWMKSKYLVFVFPYVLSRGYIEFVKALRIPNEFRFDRWFSGMTQPLPIPVCIGILILFSVGMCLLAGYLFCRALKWRLEDGWN